MKIVDCHVVLDTTTTHHYVIDRSCRRDFIGGVVENRVISDRDDPFFTVKTVNVSSLHDEGRLDDALHQFHSIELVNALQMGVSWSILVRLSCLSLLSPRLAGTNLLLLLLLLVTRCMIP
jgi:hypothetical protein